MSDLAVVAMALVTWWAALGAWAVPRWLGVAVVLAGLGLRRPVVLVVGAGLLAAGLAAVALDGLHLDRGGDVRGWATLADDPRDAFGAVRVEVRLDGRHYDAWARGGPAAALRPRLAGEQVRLSARAVALHGDVAAWSAWRHVGARLDVTMVDGWRPGSPASRAANRVRQHLGAAVRPLDDERRSLVLGVAVGDDRGQPEDMTESFRAAGLSHLLAVSGQNVAFVLILAGPLLRRVPITPRWLVTAVVLALFAVLTRFEPSVLRAVAMAALAATSLAVGRPLSRLRLLGLAVTGLVLVDPLLVRSIGFRLSVGATLGILLLAQPLARRLPGPRVVGELVAVTVAAQVGVAPVALVAFGSLPLASIPANLLAVPTAGLLSAWGLSALVVGGAAGGAVAALVRWPAALAASWIGGVASAAAQLPLGRVTPRWALVLLAAVLAWRATAWVASHRDRRPPTRPGSATP